MKKFLILISIFLWFSLSIFYVSHAGNLNKKELIKIDSTLSEDNVYIVLLMNNIKYPAVVLSQIIIESGHLTSDLCKFNNNLLGMNVAHKRETTALNDSGFAEYKTWFDCILDYKLYQDNVLRKHPHITKKQYIAYLGRTYAESPNYNKVITAKTKIVEKKYNLIKI